MADIDSWVDVAPPPTSDVAPPRSYYKVLKIDDTATMKQLRQAYIKASLESHPDDLDKRSEGHSDARTGRLRLFQEIGDAYHTLSDAARVEGYKKAKFQKQYFLVEKTSDLEDIQLPYSQQFLDAVKYELENLDDDSVTTGNDLDIVRMNRPENVVAEPVIIEDSIAGNAGLEDVLVDNQLESPVAGTTKSSWRKTYSWTIAGFMSGAALGFIAGGPPGVIILASFGYWSGSRRDATGKSVLEEYQSLASEEKRALIRKLFKFFRVVEAVLE